MKAELLIDLKGGFGCPCPSGFQLNYKKGAVVEVESWAKKAEKGSYPLEDIYVLGGFLIPKRNLKFI